MKEFVQGIGPWGHDHFWGSTHDGVFMTLYFNYHPDYQPQCPKYIDIYIYRFSVSTIVGPTQVQFGIVSIFGIWCILWMQTCWRARGSWKALYTLHRRFMELWDRIWLWSHPQRISATPSDTLPQDPAEQARRSFVLSTAPIERFRALHMTWCRLIHPDKCQDQRAVSTYHAAWSIMWGVKIAAFPSLVYWCI